MFFRDDYDAFFISFFAFPSSRTRRMRWGIRVVRRRDDPEKNLRMHPSLLNPNRPTESTPSSHIIPIIIISHYNLPTHPSVISSSILSLFAPSISLEAVRTIASNPRGIKSGVFPLFLFRALPRSATPNSRPVSTIGHVQAVFLKIQHHRRSNLLADLSATRNGRINP